jgi:FlgD Ig-like domain
MYKKIAIKLIVLLVSHSTINEANSQSISIPALQRDDFQSHKSWWLLNSTDPYQNDPVINNGYILIRNESPFAYGGTDLHNVGFESASLDRIYFETDTVRLKVRVRFLTTHFPGSRGFGWWYKESMTLDKSEQAWFLQQKEEDGHTWTATETFWRADQSNGKFYSTHDTVDLSQTYLTGWHEYRIDRYGTNRIEYFVDDSSVMTSTTSLPDNGYDYHQWIDNWVYHNTPAGGDQYDITILPRFWTGVNEMICDYVEIKFGSQSVDYSVTPAGIVKLREYPNIIAPAGTDSLIKSYVFTSDGGKSLILITAKAETYAGYDNPDLLRVEVDNFNYGYGSAKSWDGSVLKSSEKTVMIDTVLSAGTHNLKLYSTTTPVLYDVNVLNSLQGDTIFEQTVNESAPVSSNNLLWKIYNFALNNDGEVGIYITASADENSGWAYRGPDNSSPNVDDAADDDLRIELDVMDYGWQSQQSWYGNREFGELKTILLHESLTAGSHQLRFYANNTPTLNQVVIYAENKDIPLPVELSSFSASGLGGKNTITWVTESELENAGFNVLRAVSSSEQTPPQKNFIKINAELIRGRGNASIQKTYTYVDEFNAKDQIAWYMIQDVSISGKIESHGPIRLIENIQPGKFELKQNYPNPFNPETYISFSLPEASKVKINIYDINGRLINTLAEQEFSNGEHTLVWDGKDSRNNVVASGVYYYRLTSEAYNQIKKMTLIH